MLRSYWLLMPAFLLLLATGCKKDTSYLYEVNTITINPNNGGKTKQKSQEQFINIAYANFFQEALAPNDLVDISKVVTSIGDKQIAFETIISKMIVDPNVVIPSNQEMRTNLETFIEETYKRFYVRIPTEAEKTWWINYLQSNTDVKPELVYFSFATSNEYYYY
ncbi:MAG: hypothetical protein AAGH79_00155 [Bacteroidota bacterium]